MMFWSVSEHFANLRHVEDAKLVFQPRMHYFGVPKLWSIHSSPLDSKWCLRVFPEHFSNLRYVKDEKLVFRARMHYFGYQSCEASILVHWTQNDVPECFRAFRKPWASKRRKLVFRARMQYFGVLKLWSIHSSPLDPKWCLGVSWMISLIFDTYKMQDLCSSLNALFRVTEVVKHPF
jgi:hypothetical protein